MAPKIGFASLEATAAVQKYPNHPSRTIAGILIETHPQLYTSLEHARSMVRAARGERGKKMRKERAGKLICADKQEALDFLIRLPQPIEQLEPWHAYQITFKKALVIQDVHIPYHDNVALSIALAAGKRENVDTIIINGDLMDFYNLSFWEKDPRQRGLEAELESGKLFFECLRDMFPKAEIIFKEGNHEERLWRYVWAKCPELCGVRNATGGPLVATSNILDLGAYGVKLVTDKKPILAGPHLYLLHGHEFRVPLTNPVNPARGLYNRAKANAFCGDLHQTSEHSEAGLGKIISCWSGGCLCDLHPRYMPINKWNLGFAFIDLAGDAWQVRNHKIINGHIV